MPLSSELKLGPLEWLVQEVCRDPNMGIHHVTCKHGAEREGDTESEAGSGLRAVSTEPDAGLELTDREIVT